jgi:hypothetical protein
MKRIILLAMATLFALALHGCSDDSGVQAPAADNDILADGGFESSTPLRAAEALAKGGMPRGMARYEIIVENLTPATGDGASQPFSPPILATHEQGMHVFRFGEPASDALAMVAEDAQGDALIEMLEGSSRVHEVAVGDGVILPGDEARFEIGVDGAMRRLSMVFMLVNTNDAFGGLDGAKLPMWGETTVSVRAWDAGSEQNTELAEHIPGPCCGSPGMGLDEDKPVRFHPGLTGDGDLDPDLYGFDRKVARVTIRRLDPVYEITLTNLTPATVEGGSQVFSPPLLATHMPSVGMFRVGSYATDALALLAEDGDRSGLLDALGSSPKVRDAAVADAPIGPGGSATWTITAGKKFKRLSAVFMLVNTNDAFSGVDRILLPEGGSESWYLATYDAGSEANTELAEHIPGPCCGSPGMGEDERLRIRMHEGITGVGDLDPADYGWEDPAAMLTITRVR